MVWLWLVYGGWRDYYHAHRRALDGLPEPAGRRRGGRPSARPEPGEVLETEVSAVIYGGVASVSRLQADGSVEA